MLLLICIQLFSWIKIFRVFVDKNIDVLLIQILYNRVSIESLLIELVL